MKRRADAKFEVTPKSVAGVAPSLHGPWSGSRYFIVKGISGAQSDLCNHYLHIRVGVRSADRAAPGPSRECAALEHADAALDFAGFGFMNVFPFVD